MSLFDRLVSQALQARSELTADKAVVEKELLHHDILREMSAAGLLGGLTFIGGTCLRACYGSVRLSEDLDFTGGADFLRLSCNVPLFDAGGCLKAGRTCSLSGLAPESNLERMVSGRDKAIISKLARRYGAARVWLFGSNANQRRRGRDLDLAVEGVPPGRFFDFVGELMLSLSQPVDVVRLEDMSKLSALIRRDGLPIYGYPPGEG